MLLGKKGFTAMRFESSIEINAPADRVWALLTNLTRFYILEPIDNRTRVTVGGEVSGALALLAKRGGQVVSKEVARAAKKRVEESE
jgi:hypothetical protein